MEIGRSRVIHVTDARQPRSEGAIALRVYGRDGPAEGVVGFGDILMVARSMNDGPRIALLPPGHRLSPGRTHP